MKSLRDKILDENSPVIFYELLPPSQVDVKNIDAYVSCAMDLLSSTHIGIDAVNIPDIQDEVDPKNGRSKSWVPKMDCASFAQLLEESSYNHLEVVLNHCTVSKTLEEQLQWIGTTTKRHNIRSLILVGGSSSKINYPGPSVLEMGQYIKKEHQQLFCGGISIQTRRHQEPDKDEPYRLYIKGENGLYFFTSQIIYEPVSMKFLLRDYARFCTLQGVKPKRLFLSFAPVSTRKDVEFLRWLGVSIPKTIEHELLKADIGIGWRSTKIAINILQEILNFMREENIGIPLGLNIEHITRHNFELSFEFIQRLGTMYNDYMHLRNDAAKKNIEKH